MGHVHARGTHIFVYFIFYQKSAHVRRLNRGNMYHIVNIVNTIGKAHFPIGCDSLSVLGVDVPSMVAISLFLTLSAHTPITLYHNNEYCDLKAN